MSPRYETLRYEVDSESGVATIALDQPETRNALSGRALDDLLAAFAAAGDDDEVRCVVLASTHETVFSSGANLGELASVSPLLEKYDAIERIPRLLRLIGQLGKPTICAASGHVLAGALGLALACDLIVASERATFGTPEIKVGLFPFIITALLYRSVPRKKANELLLLGERVDAHEALRLGIVNRVVPDGELDDAVVAWARKLASRSPALMRLGKDAMYRQQDLPFDAALELLRHDLALALATEDFREGVEAFFAGREPRWRGR